MINEDIWLIQERQQSQDYWRYLLNNKIISAVLPCHIPVSQSQMCWSVLPSDIIPASTRSQASTHPGMDLPAPGCWEEEGQACLRTELVFIWSEDSGWGKTEWPSVKFSASWWPFLAFSSSCSETAEGGVITRWVQRSTNCSVFLAEMALTGYPWPVGDRPLQKLSEEKWKNWKIVQLCQGRCMSARLCYSPQKRAVS